MVQWKAASCIGMDQGDGADRGLVGGADDERHVIGDEVGHVGVDHVLVHESPQHRDWSSNATAPADQACR